MDYPKRQTALRARLSTEKVEAALVSSPANLRYLTGFTGSNALLLLEPHRATLFTDGRYRQQAAAEVVGARVMIQSGDLWQAAARRAKAISSLAWSHAHVTLAQRQRFLALWTGRPARMRDSTGWIEQLRSVKDPDEIAALRRAIALADSVFAPTLARVAPGLHETALAAELEFALRRQGGEGLAFDTILASGPRSARIHGRPSPLPLAARGFLLFDYGVILEGYRSDMSRTVHLGRPSPKARALYQTVLEAQAAAIAAIRPGVAAAAVDRAARQVIGRAGFAKEFSHSTGHGVGLDIHEEPRLASRSPGLLVAGQVVTVEPGIYLAGWGGVRIEDMVLVTERGAEVLTPTPRELLSI